MQYYDAPFYFLSNQNVQQISYQFNNKKKFFETDKVKFGELSNFG